MDRPKQNDYKMFVVDGSDTVHLFDFKYWDYIDELEKYCNWLEDRLHYNVSIVNKIRDLLCTDSYK